MDRAIYDVPFAYAHMVTVLIKFTILFSAVRNRFFVVVGCIHVFRHSLQQQQQQQQCFLICFASLGHRSLRPFLPLSCPFPSLFCPSPVSCPTLSQARLGVTTSMGLSDNASTTVRIVFMATAGLFSLITNCGFQVASTAPLVPCGS